MEFLYPWVSSAILCLVFYHPVLLGTASWVPIAIAPHLYCSNTASLCWSHIFCSAKKNCLLKVPIEKLQLHCIILFKDKHKLNKLGNRHLVIRKMLWLNKEEKFSKRAKTCSDKVLQVIIPDFPLPELLYHTQLSAFKSCSAIFMSPHNTIRRKRGSHDCVD